MKSTFTISMMALLIGVIGLGFASAASYEITESYEGVLLTPIFEPTNHGGYAICVDYPEAGDAQYYLQHEGVRTPIGTLGGTRVSPVFVNDFGQVVGSSLTTGNAFTHAFLLDAGTMKDLGTLGGNFSEALRINNGGQVMGNSLTASDQYRRAFVYRDGLMSDLGTLGGTSASAASMNERGQIVGSSLTGSGHCHAFLWNNGSTADLGVLGGAYLSSHAVDINSSGQVVGNCSISDDDLDSLHDISRDSVSCRPFLYSNGAMVDINDLVDAPHGTFQLVRSIDDAGRITVYGSQMIDWGLYREYTYVLSPVPEPSTAVLSALGLFGFAGYALRRRG